MEASGFNDLKSFGDLFQFQRIVLLGLGLALLAYLVRLLHRGATALADKFPTRRLLLLQVDTTASFLLYIGGGMLLVYAVLNPTRELLFALGGSAAVAIGFSLKDLVASLIAGMILLFDRPFQVGDRVQYNDTYGEIKSIGLRAVRLQTLDDNLVTIPNARFITDVVASGNAGELDMMITVPFHFALDADIEAARDILYEVVVTSRFVYLKKPITMVASELAVAERLAIQLMVKAYVLDVRYEKAFQTDIVMRGTRALREHRIARPPINVSPGVMPA